MIKSIKNIILVVAFMMVVTNFFAVSYFDKSLLADAQPLDTDFGSIRVKLSTGTETKLTVDVVGKYTIKENGKVISDGTLIVTISSKSLKATFDGKTIYTGTPITLIRKNTGNSGGYLGIYNKNCSKSEPYYPRRHYLGNVTFSYTSSGVRAINTVPMNQYLYGVVAIEQGEHSNIEAIKAQAVTSKVYALSELSPKSSYDIDDTSNDQLYIGYNPKYSNSINAVNAVSNVSMYIGNNKVFRAFFGDSNGGQTEIPSNNWNGVESWDPAFDIRIDDYDIENTASKLDKVFFSAKNTTENITKKLNTFLLTYANDNLSGYKATSITSIENLYSHTDSGDTSGRDHTKLTIEMTVNADKTSKGITSDSFDLGYIDDVKAYDSKTFMFENNPTAVSSSKVKVKMTFKLADLYSKGVMTKTGLRIYYALKTDGGWNVLHGRSGPGVGLSNRGAQVMAEKYGMNYAQILHFYFPGAIIAGTDVSYEREKGDVNGDYKVDSEDATLILRCVVGLYEIKGDDLEFADCDSNGEIDTHDAVCILRIAAEINK